MQRSPWEGNIDFTGGLGESVGGNRRDQVGGWMETVLGETTGTEGHFRDKAEN